ncbi:MAG: LysM peptidoglycan-binding domain-containing protein [Caldilineaceae bacterium]|nr:LysM peptidoglycan-binding domain-containing protein [Caldilineaceae bacterium]
MPQTSIPNRGPADVCPGCHAPVLPGQAACAVCGTVLHSQPKQIRCRHCGKKGSSAYALCPHCGRQLVAAPPLWLAWGLPIALVLLFGVVVMSRMEGNPLAWIEAKATDSVAIGENPILTPVRAGAETDGGATAGIDPIAPAETPVPALAPPTASATETSAPTAMDTDTPQPTETPEPTASPTASPVVETVSPTASSTVSSTASSTASPTASTGTLSPTATGSASNSAASSVTPTAESSNLTYIVQEGDSVFSIATRFQISVADLLKANQLAPAAAIQLQPGAVLKIPGSGSSQGSAEPAVTLAVTAIATSTITSTVTAAATAATSTSTPISTTAPTQTATPTPTATQIVQATPQGQRTYTVVSGDTPVAIALRFNISTEALLAFNGLSIAQARNLQVGQVLIIPAAGQPLPPTATPTQGLRPYTVQTGDTIVSIASRNGIAASLLLAVNRMTEAQARNIRPGDELIIPPPGYVLPTATPRPPLATFTPTPTPTTAIRLSAPRQIDPAQGINVQCIPNQEAKWQAVDGLLPGDEYKFSLGYVNSLPDATGKVEVLPLLEQRTGQRLSMRLNPEFCSLAAQEFGRRWRWYVQIFNGGTPVSPPSETWEFTWR